MQEHIEYLRKYAEVRKSKLFRSFIPRMTSISILVTFTWWYFTPDQMNLMTTKERRFEYTLPAQLHSDVRTMWIYCYQEIALVHNFFLLIFANVCISYVFILRWHNFHSIRHDFGVRAFLACMQSACHRKWAEATYSICRELSEQLQHNSEISPIGKNYAFKSKLLITLMLTQPICLLNRFNLIIQSELLSVVVVYDDCIRMIHKQFSLLCSISSFRFI